MEITFRQLRYLISLADEGHFGRAAAAVNVSQPALSVQIRELEAALGTRLVERGGREIVLTPAGREILRRARRIMDEMSETEPGRPVGAGPRRAAAAGGDPDGRALSPAGGAAAAARPKPRRSTSGCARRRPRR